MMSKGNHIFNFSGGEMLARMGAWWFVSYSYYLHIDPSHDCWRKVSTEAARRSVYNRSKEFHIYWLSEVLNMQNLDKQGNSGNLRACEIKRMAEELIPVLVNNDEEAELQIKIDKLRAKLEILRKDEQNTGE